MNITHCNMHARTFVGWICGILCCVKNIVINTRDDRNYNGIGLCSLASEGNRSQTRNHRHSDTIIRSLPARQSNAHRCDATYSSHVMAIAGGTPIRCETLACNYFIRIISLWSTLALDSAHHHFLSETIQSSHSFVAFVRVLIIHSVSRRSQHHFTHCVRTMLGWIEATTRSVSQVQKQAHHLHSFPFSKRAYETTERSRLAPFP